MAYQRFKVPEMRLDAATVATPATVAGFSREVSQLSQVSQGMKPKTNAPPAQSVATVASVAAAKPETGNPAIVSRSGYDEAVLTVPAGDDPFATAASDCKTARPQLREGGESWRPYDAAPVPTYDPERLQREADRRNAEAARNRSTDRYCRCGHLATFAWPGDDGRPVWICDECAPTRGVA